MHTSEPQVHDYCTAYIDLLGIRNALHGQALVPTEASTEDRAAFRDSVNASLGAISRLHEAGKRLAEDMQLADFTPDPPIPDDWPTRREWAVIAHTNVKMQTWSDGLIYFSDLDEERIRAPAAAIEKIFLIISGLYTLGLAEKRPIRGGIDIAWGSELKPGQLFGAALARAYELESQVAQYPRVVVHDRVVTYLQKLAQKEAESFAEAFNARCAVDALEYLHQDMDGYWVVRPLGGAYTSGEEAKSPSRVIASASEFVDTQLSEFKGRDAKLALRYAMLRRFLDSVEAI